MNFKERKKDEKNSGCISSGVLDASTAPNSRQFVSRIILSEKLNCGDLINVGYQSDTSNLRRT